jgi:hypothetical protein
MPRKSTATTAAPATPGTYVVELADGTVFTVKASSPGRAEGVARREWVKAFGGPATKSVRELDRTAAAA